MSQQNIHSEKILILDFGSQVTQLIARRVREIGVYCEIYPFDADLNLIKNFGAQGIILSGSPESTTEAGSPRAPEWVFEAGVPVLGICYGLQTMTVQLGGKVQGSSKREYGHATVDIKAKCPLFDGLTDHEGETKLDVWMSHGDKVTAIPEGFTTIGSTETCPYAAIYNESKKFFGVQFHPEVTHSKQGAEILKRFVIDVCGLHGLWSPSAIIEDAVKSIREQVGDKKVLLGLSGGVDSSVTALLLQKAIGKQLTCVFVDNGLLRLNEGAQVEQMFKPLDLNFVYADASDRFLNALKGISDPELKRKAIGKTFIDVFADEARKLDGVEFLAQGTIYPDVIESGLGKSATIKSHHNVGGLPDYVDFKEIVEPLRDLFKDEVRRAGLELGIPEYLVYRQPFPGPGLGIRIIGEVTAEKVRIVQEADFIYRDEIAKAGIASNLGQYFAALTNMRSVGVMGDERTYDYAIALRAVNTVDFMTAEAAQIPWEVLNKVANRIVNEVKGVNRVLYDCTGKPPATIEFE